VVKLPLAVPLTAILPEIVAGTINRAVGVADPFARPVAALIRAVAHRLIERNDIDAIDQDVEEFPAGSSSESAKGPKPLCTETCGAAIEVPLRKP
jgi:hypothetical protein